MMLPRHFSDYPKADVPRTFQNRMTQPGHFDAKCDTTPFVASRALGGGMGRREFLGPIGSAAGYMAARGGTSVDVYV